MVEMNAVLPQQGDGRWIFPGSGWASEAGMGKVLDPSKPLVETRWNPGGERSWAGHLPLLPLLHGLGRLPFLTSLIGMDQEQKPLQLNYSAAGSWHMIVEGPHGSGKSSLLRACAAGLAFSNRQSQLQFIGIDHGGRDLVFLESIPHLLTDLAADPGFTEEILGWLVGEAEHRRLWQIANPQLIVWIDDVDMLTQGLSRLALEQLSRLWMEGPVSGIHLAVSSSTKFSNMNTIFRSLASSVHISLTGRTHGPIRSAGEDDYRGILREGRRSEKFRPVSFLARDMNTAASLFRSGFRLSGTSLYEVGRSDGR